MDDSDIRSQEPDLFDRKRGATGSHVAGHGARQRGLYPVLVCRGVPGCVGALSLRLAGADLAIFFLHLHIFYPVTSDFSAWYAGDFVLALIIALALAGFAFYTSLAGQPLFRATLPE
jgi:hypothetical protein